MLDSPLSEHENGVSVQPGLVYAGDVVHLLHVVPEPSMIHVWPGMYVPPDDNAEQEEVQQSQSRTMRLTHGVSEFYLLVCMRCFCSINLHPSCWNFLGYH